MDFTCKPWALESLCGERSLGLIQHRIRSIVPRPVLRYNQSPHHRVVDNMSGESSIRDRRSTRLSISIPVTISGADADGHAYSENVRTVIINKHGGKIATTRHLTMGTEILIENHAMGLAAKASVAWLGEKPSAGDSHHVGLQLLEAQNICKQPASVKNTGLSRGVVVVVAEPRRGPTLLRAPRLGPGRLDHCGAGRLQVF